MRKIPRLKPNYMNNWLITLFPLKVNRHKSMRRILKNKICRKLIINKDKKKYKQISYKKREKLKRLNSMLMQLKLFKSSQTKKLRETSIKLL